MFEILEWWKSALLGTVAVIGAVVTLTRWGRAASLWSFAQVGQLFGRHKDATSAPKPTPANPASSRPLRFVMDDHQSFWHAGNENGEPATQLHGAWHVTNVSERDVVILKARLVGHNARHAIVCTAPARPHGLWDTKNPIRAGTMSDLTADFFFRPSICDGDAPLVADLVFIDNYGDEHVVTGATFRRR